MMQQDQGAGLSSPTPPAGPMPAAALTPEHSMPQSCIPVAILAAALLAPCPSALADLVPPNAFPAAKRLSENPRAFDRTDDFCTGKKVGDACEIPGSRLSGGGPGTCDNAIHRGHGTIDLLCRRTGRVVLDRGLPEDGFVADPEFCAGIARLGDEGKPMASHCVPPHIQPVDRFCAGKTLGDACTVDLEYAGQTERHLGTCREEVQTRRFYHQGQRTLTRKAVLCLADPLPPPNLKPLSWWQKLLQ